MMYIKGGEKSVPVHWETPITLFLKQVSELLILLTLQLTHHYSFCGNRNLLIALN